MEAHLELTAPAVLVTILLVLSGCGSQPETPALAAERSVSGDPAGTPGAPGTSGAAENSGAAEAAGVEHPWPQTSDGERVLASIAVPDGFRRAQVNPDSFGAWLRTLPLHDRRRRVMLHSGWRKLNQSAHFAVVDIDVGEHDLQQCADAVMRLRAEYLRSADCSDSVTFNFTSGDPARWSDWAAGIRPQVDGNRVDWARTAEPDESYDSFRRYLELVFTYAGSVSLSRELSQVTDPADVRAGDVFIQGGFPGHAVIVVDVAENDAGERAFLLAQSYMPAQDIHVLRGPEGRRDDPWYPARSAGTLETPEWTFDYGDLRRFAAVCQAEAGSPESGSSNPAR